ncbi:MAG: phiHau3 26 [Sphingomonadales bacterium]|nr:phiHau3 26 [Sphingomonadales bacterium]
MSCSNCGSDSLLIVGGDGITVAGSGSGTNPYKVSSTAPTFGEILQVEDTETVNLYVSGGAAVGDPIVLKAESRLKVTDLSDVQDPEGGPQPGESIVWTGVGSAGRWVFSTLPPAPAGSVNVGNGISGAGTAGDPIRARTSGIWGSGPLAGLGTDTLVGLATYIDAAGNLRVQPPSATVVTWGGITGRPSVFPPSAHDHSVDDINVGSVTLLQYLQTTYSLATHVHTSIRNTARNTIWSLDGNGNANYSVDGVVRWSIGQFGGLTIGTVPWASITGRPSVFPPDVHNVGGAVHTGILGIEKGGTGGNSLATARANLQVYSLFDTNLKYPTKNPENSIAFSWDGNNGKLGVFIDGGVLGYITTTPVSATRFKDQISAWTSDMDVRLDSFLAMDDYFYVERRDVRQELQIGWMAERVLEAGFPEIVPIERDPARDDFGLPTSVDYSRAVVILHAALKREVARNKDLLAAQNLQAGQIESLLKRLDKLEGGA